MRHMVLAVWCRRRSIRLWATIGVAVTVLLVIVVNLAIAPSYDRKAYPLYGRKIAIDPGHGGIDPGTHDRMGFMEKDINLDLSLRLKAYFLQRGASVFLTRERDMDFDEWEDEDIRKRKALVKESGADVALGIHVDASRDPSVKGGQVFYNPKSAQGKALAARLQAALKKLQPYNSNVALPGDLYIVNIDIPSALIEIGYITNPDEKSLMKRPEYLQELAEAIGQAVEEYLLEEKAS